MSARILIIEDNADNLEMMQYLLVHFGHTVLTAPDGEAGVEVARLKRPDLILCDIHMPKLDGFGVARKLKRDTFLSVIPLVAVTALAMVGDRSKILAGGFDGYIGKPINPGDFLDEVEAFLPVPLRCGSGSSVVSEQVSAPKARIVPRSLGKVMVVDDSQVNIHLYESTLEPVGYTVISVNCIEEALRVGQRERPDIVLVDYVLKNGTGIDVVNALRSDAVLSSTPAIIISSSISPAGYHKNNPKNKDIPFYSRPMDPRELIRIINETIRNVNLPTRNRAMAEAPGKV